MEGIIKINVKYISIYVYWREKGMFQANIRNILFIKDVKGNGDEK